MAYAIHIGGNKSIAYRVSRHNPDIVFIALGTNDWKLENPDQFRIDYNFLIDEIQAQNPDVIIILLKFPYLNDPTRNFTLAQSYQDVIGDVAQENNLVWIDIWELTYEKSCESSHGRNIGNPFRV